MELSVQEWGTLRLYFGFLLVVIGILIVAAGFIPLFQRTGLVGKFTDLTG